MLDPLKSKKDKDFKEVHDLREKYGADVVIAVVDLHEYVLASCIQLFCANINASVSVGLVPLTFRMLRMPSRLFLRAVQPGTLALVRTVTLS